MTESDVRRLVKQHVKRAGGIRALSREWEVSPAMLSDFATGRRGPGAKILGPLGLKQVKSVVYKACR